MLHNARNPALNLFRRYIAAPCGHLLQKIKVWALRKYYRYASARGWKGQAITASHSTLQIPSADGAMAARMYSNDTGASMPLIVYFHGGGWVIGDLQTHHPFCHTLSARTGCSVISVDYRLAPEHPFPAAQEDAIAAANWLAERAGQLAPCDGSLVIAGDSAGAHLATCTCLEIGAPARDNIVGEIVIYPVTDHYTAGFNSYVDRARGQMLTANFMHWFWDTYLGDCSADAPAAAAAMPLRAADVSSLPPTLLVTAEYDPLRDEGIAYADKLRGAGVALRYRHFDTAAHGFACSEGPNQNFNDFMVDLVEWMGQFRQV